MKQGMRIGEMMYADVEDAMVDCNCGHRVLCNQAQEVWVGSKVTEVCNVCFSDESLWLENC